jgi:uncharacterized Zn finger protein
MICRKCEKGVMEKFVEKRVQAGMLTCVVYWKCLSCGAVEEDTLKTVLKYYYRIIV